MWGAIGAGLLGSYLGSELDKKVLGGNGQLGAIAGGMAGGSMGNAYLDSSGAVSGATEQFAQQGLTPNAGELNPAGTGLETGGGYVPETAGFDPRAGVDKLNAEGQFQALGESGIAGQKDIKTPETYLGMTGDQWGQTAVQTGAQMAVNQTPPPQQQAPIAGQGITKGQVVDTKGLLNLSSNPFLKDRMKRGQY
jgi:hypothetical protein